MGLKQLIKYRLNFDKEWLTASGLWMGAAFFLQAVYYFGIADLRAMGFWAILVLLILPMLAEAAWFVLLRGVKLNAPGVYGILAAALNLIILLQTLLFGGLLGGIISILTCLLAGVCILAVTGGYVRSRFVAVAACILALALRFIFGGLPNLLPEISVYLTYFGVFALLGGMEPAKNA